MIRNCFPDSGGSQAAGGRYKLFAVVTGASSGIGYELAKQFAQNGFDLLITATGATIQDATRDL